MHTCAILTAIFLPGTPFNKIFLDPKSSYIKLYCNTGKQAFAVPSTNFWTVFHYTLLSFAVPLTIFRQCLTIFCFPHPDSDLLIWAAPCFTLL